MKRKFSNKSARFEIANIGQDLSKRAHEAFALLLVALGLYFLLAMLSYTPNDPSWANNVPAAEAKNLGGAIGAWLAYTLYFFLGVPAAVLVPLSIFTSAWYLFRQRQKSRWVRNEHLLIWVTFLLTIAACCGLATLHFVVTGLPTSSGGRLGEMVARGFYSVFGMVGSTLLLLGLVVAGLTMMVNISWIKLMDLIGAAFFWLIAGLVSVGQWCRNRWFVRQQAIKRKQSVLKRKRKLQYKTLPKIEPLADSLLPSKQAKRAHQIKLAVGDSAGELPPLNLLEGEPQAQSGYSKDDLEKLARQLEIKMEDFGINAQVTEAQPGPVVTRFEVLPAPGTKASSISSLEKDLARSLSLPSIRVVEVIPGKSSIGIEVPNQQRSVVCFGEILHSVEYEKQRSLLTLVLGKDVAGQAVFVDLEKLPHLLIAGTTGAGKSVAVHAMLASLLFRNLPSQVRLILIDPKMLELKVYEDIPHLLVPVITDMQEATNALRWAVAEMEQRYRLMSALGTRNIAAYHRKLADARKQGKPITDPLFKQESQDDTASPPLLDDMPYIVVVIDEFADMMMVVGKQVEDLIIRLAQKARAAGIHLVLATQRPSVDIITGLVKANVPARIAFQVSSKVDSRTILDQNGAEQLLGQGDMLCLLPGHAIPMRVHGAFISDDEVQAMTDFLRSQGTPSYLSDLHTTAAQNNALLASAAPDAETDPLYDQAVAIVTESRKASISYLQRRLKIGYNRAARMIEDMERANVVSQIQSSGAREVLAPPPPES